MAMGEALEHVGRLAREVEFGLPVGPGAIRIGVDGSVEVRRPPPASRHHFFLDGLLFRVSITPRPGATLFQIWAEVGYLPYTIEAPEKRRTLGAILRAADSLDHARFHVDECQKILVLGQRDVPGSLTLTDLMHETVEFLREARPYLRLLGRYL